MGDQQLRLSLCGDNHGTGFLFLCGVSDMDLAPFFPRMKGRTALQVSSVLPCALSAS